MAYIQCEYGDESSSLIEHVIYSCIMGSSILLHRAKFSNFQFQPKLFNYSLIILLNTKLRIGVVIGILNTSNSIIQVNDIGE